MGEGSVEQAVDLASVVLDVYESRQGWWSPDHGDVELPQGWSFLPSGEAFVTRTVKASGAYWLAWAPRNRNHRHRRLLGLLAPQLAIAAALDAAAATEARRAVRRAASARSRTRHEARYQDDLTAAIVDFLAFAPEHQELAQRIALAAAARAAVVGSGRVGRTRMLPVAERAALAARAELRHSYTDYEEQLGELLTDVDADSYRYVKGKAHAAVDAFLEAHRSGSGQGT